MQKPLTGIRVLAIENFIAGPFASMWLGDAGAEVVKIETPDSASICSCNNVSKGAIKEAIRAGSLSVISDVKKATCAGTGCAVMFCFSPLARSSRRSGCRAR